MYSFLLSFHSVFRWIVLASLSYAIVRAYRRYKLQLPFIKTDNTIRHWTATIAHIQLMAGIILYTQSPVVKYFFADNAKNAVEPLFFGLIHIAMMIVAIVLITIGSAKAKRNSSDTEKFRIMFIWFSIALIIIFAAIPWPFSPLSARPYFRTF